MENAMYAVSIARKIGARVFALQINIVEDFKYLESYVGSTERDIKVRFGLGWAACQTHVNFKVTEDQTQLQDLFI